MGANRSVASHQRRPSQTADSPVGLSAKASSPVARDLKPGDVARREDVAIQFDRPEHLCRSWPSPICIISDGPYGVSGFPGDAAKWSTLAEWYEPHIAAWTLKATPQTTLW